jgi:hypothetical protein|tara:strand:+ start:325 stop:501 length:177 start_codon:yes stop_codon:yes gene_type:complete
MDLIVNIVAWVTAIVTCSSIIAAITPTPKDDIWIGKLYKFIDLLALNIGKAKEKSSGG